MKPSILIVDDDIAFTMMLTGFLERKGYSVNSARNVLQAVQMVSKTTPSLILTDYRLPDHTGMELLKEVQKINSTIPLLMMTGYGEIRLAVQAIREGAVDYLTKPIQQDELIELIKNILQNPASQNDKSIEKKLSAPEGDYVEGKSLHARLVTEHIQLVAPTNYSVLILGESGTGKEYVARRIHQLSERSKAPFVAVDCGAMTNDVASGEFFGYVKGAFTGANTDKPGIFEQADGGTIFLDEIGNLSYDNQVRLLRVIQERKCRRLGDTKDRPVDVRLITATNENLKDAIDQGRFREDLYHRINEFAIQIPPLRDREEDKIIFSGHFLRLSNHELGKDISRFSDDALDYIKKYHWPGNLREMKNVIKRAALLTKGNSILPESLPLELKIPQELKIMEPDHTAPVNSLKSLTTSIEKQQIIDALQKFRYNRSQTARYLGIDRKTLYNRIKRYGLE